MTTVGLDRALVLEAGEFLLLALEFRVLEVELDSEKDEGAR
jgi:hypothetical protein